MKIRKVLILIVSIALAACTSTASPTAGGSSGSPTNAPTIVPTETLTQTPSNETVSVADLKNGTYLIDGQSITLVDGVAENELTPGSASKQVTRYLSRIVKIFYLPFYYSHSTAFPESLPIR